MENNTNLSSSSFLLSSQHLIYLNTLLTKLSLEPITNLELKSFITLLSQILFDNQNKKYTSIFTPIILKSASRYTIPIYNSPQINISKIMLTSLIASLLIQIQSQCKFLPQLKLLLCIIGKLYNDSYLNKTDIYNYIVILINLALSQSYEALIYNKRGILFENVFDLLSSTVVIDSKRNQSELLLAALAYIKTEVIDKEKHLFQLSKNMTYFKFGCLVNQFILNYSIKNIDMDKDKDCIRKTILAKVNEVLIPIYQNQFSNALMKTNINLIKNSILNYNTKDKENITTDLLSSGYQMNFLTNCSLYESNKEKADIYQINRGFTFNGEGRKGLKCNITTQLKNFTIIFSIKLIPYYSHKQQASYPILSFYSSEKIGFNVLSFSINSISKDNTLKYYFALSTEQEQNKLIEDIEIIPYQSYLFIITGYPSMSVNKLKIKCNSQPIINLDTKKIKEKSTICYIGYKPESKLNTINNNDSVFQGEIGTVIILKDIISEQIVFNLANLRGQYDSLFDVSQYEIFHLRKYIDIMTFNDKFYHMAQNCFHKQGQLIMDMTIVIISPLTFQLAYNDNGDLENENKFFYKFNYLNINQNELKFQEKVELLSQFSDDFGIFERNATVFELLKMEGFNFIILHLEYYYSLITNHNKSIEMDYLKRLILDDIEQVIYFLSTIFNQIIITEYIQELQTVVYLISVIFAKLFDNYSSNTESSSLNTEIFNHLIKMIIILKPEIQENTVEKETEDLRQLQTSLVSLILNHQLYSKVNLYAHNSLFETFIAVLQEQHSFCSNLAFFQRLLQFSNVFNVSINKSQYNIKSNYYMIISNYFAVKQNIFRLIVLYVNEIILNREQIRVIYTLVRILFLHSDSNIIKQLFSYVDLSDFFHEMLIDSNTNSNSITLMKEKHFNLLFQLLLSNRKYMLNIDVSNFKMYPISLIIKNLIISLYDTSTMSNKDKLKKLKGKDIGALDVLNFNAIDKELFFVVIDYCSVLLSQLSSKNINNKTEVTEEDKEDYVLTYSVLIKFIINLLQIDNTHIIYTTIFHEKEEFCSLVFLNAIFFHIPCQDALIEISNQIILKHKNPFIFVLLKSIIALRIVPDILLSLYKLISQLLSSLETDNCYLINNITHYLLFIDFFAKKDSNLYYSNLFMENNTFTSVIQILRDSFLLYTNAFILSSTSNEPKVIMEIVFDLYILMFTNTKNQCFIDGMIEFFVPKNSTVNKIKNKTIILTIDYKADSLFRIITAKANQELLNLFPQNEPKTMYADIKWTLYFLIKITLAIKTIQADSNDEWKELIVMYDKIAMALCKDICFLIDKNEIRENSDFMFNDYQELLNKYYLFYKTNGSYEKLKSAYLNYYCSNEKKSLDISQFKDMTVFQFKANESKSDKDKDKDRDKDKGDLAHITYIKTNINTKTSNDYSAQSLNITSASASTISEAKEKEIDLYNHIKLRSPNKSLIQTTFGLYFKDLLFHNNAFIKMKQYYTTTFKTNPNTKLLNYPSQRKNYSDTYHPHIFFKQNRSFFTNEYFKITHKYFTDMMPLLTPDYFTLMKRPIIIENFLYVVQCEMITLNHSHFGKIKLTNDYLFFESESSTYTGIEYTFCSMKSDRSNRSDKAIVLFYNEISEVMIRRYLLMWQAIEIYGKDGKSYFFNMFNREQMQKLFDELKPYLPLEVNVIENSLNEFKKRKYTIDWANNSLSTYDYLLQINKYASRTFNDIHQYYTFPWVLINYANVAQVDSSPALSDYRQFDKPISIQKKTDSQLVPQQSTVEKSFEKYIGGNFSTGPFVQYFMMRSTPFVYQMSRFQSMKLDVADRVFISFDSILKDLFNSSDNRELIPELYSQCEPYINMNCISIGKTQRDVQIDDVLLTYLTPNEQPTLSSYIQYYTSQLDILNSGDIAKGLPLWLDHFFGVKQNLLKEKFHICSKYSYEAKAMLDIRMEKHRLNNMPIDQSLKTINEKIQLIYTLGQTPCQITQSAHPANKKRPNDNKERKKESFIDNSTLLSSSTGRQNEIIYFTTMKKNTIICSINVAREITIYQMNDVKKNKIIRCKNFKLLKKGYKNEITLSSSPSTFAIEFSFYIFKPKYAFTILDSKIIVTCRYLDRSIKFQNMKSVILREVLTDSFVNCICKVNRNKILIGLKNGKLMEWFIEYDSLSASLPIIEKENMTIKHSRTIMAHEAGINVIIISKALNVVITAGNDNCILIRKLYDFELLTAIEIGDDRLVVVDMKISQYNLLYAMCFNKNTQLFCIRGYTMTGLCFAISESYCYNHFDIKANGTIIVGYYDKNIISYLDGCTLIRKKDHHLPNKNEQVYRFLSFKYLPEIEKHYLFYSSFVRREVKK